MANERRLPPRSKLPVPGWLAVSGLGLEWRLSTKDAWFLEPRTRSRRPRLPIHLHVAERWELDAGDLNVRAICARVEHACRGLPVDSIDALLDDVDLVVRALTAKKAWNPKTKRAQYARIARSVVSAAHLLTALKAIFPPPWHGRGRAPIALLATDVKAFILGTLGGLIPQVDSDRRRGRHALKSVKTRYGRLIAWELLDKLVRLASHNRIRVNESTLRRYIARYKRAVLPSDAYLQKHRNYIRNAVSNIPRIDHQSYTAFKAQVHQYLQA